MRPLGLILQLTPLIWASQVTSYLAHLYEIDQHDAYYQIDKFGVKRLGVVILPLIGLIIRHGHDKLLKAVDEEVWKALVISRYWDDFLHRLPEPTRTSVAGLETGIRYLGRPASAIWETVKTNIHGPISLPCQLLLMKDILSFFTVDYLDANSLLNFYRTSYGHYSFLRGYIREKFLEDTDASCHWRLSLRKLIHRYTFEGDVSRREAIMSLLLTHPQFKYYTYILHLTDSEDASKFHILPPALLLRLKAPKAVSLVPMFKLLQFGVDPEIVYEMVKKWPDLMRNNYDPEVKLNHLAVLEVLPRRIYTHRLWKYFCRIGPYSNADVVITSRLTTFGLPASLNLVLCARMKASFAKLGTSPYRDVICHIWDGDALGQILQRLPKDKTLSSAELMHCAQAQLSPAHRNTWLNKLKVTEGDWIPEAFLDALLQRPVNKEILLNALVRNVASLRVNSRHLVLAHDNGFSDHFIAWLRQFV